MEEINKEKTVSDFKEQRAKDFSRSARNQITMDSFFKPRDKPKQSEITELKEESKKIESENQNLQQKNTETDIKETKHELKTKPKYKKNFTPEEKEQYRQSKLKEQKEFIEIYKNFTQKKTIQEITNIITNYKELHNYSIRNRIFLAMQATERGDESFRGICNGFGNWRKQKIKVLKGSSSYKVLAPITKKYVIENKEGEEEKLKRYFKLVSVFDISQTSEYENYLKEREAIEKKIYKNAEIDYSISLEFVINKFSKVSIKRQIRKGDPKGEYDHVHKEIILHQETSHTLFHELGHHITINEIEIAGDIKKDYAKNEILAELTCFLLMKQFVQNVDYNFAYSNVWSNRMTENFEFGEFEKAYQVIESYINDISKEKANNSEIQKSSKKKTTYQNNQNRKIAEILRDKANKMQEQINNKLNPATASLPTTLRRAGIIKSMKEDGKYSQKIQTILYALADNHEKGTIPQLLQKIRYRTQIENLLKDDYPTCTEYTNKEYVQEVKKSQDRLRSIGINQQNFTEAKDLLESLIDLPEEDPIQIQIREAEYDLIGRKIDGFFPTPHELAEKMVKMADIKENDQILEPSAGHGSIAEKIRELYPDNKLSVIEINYTLSKILDLKGFKPIRSDFLEHTERYDRILMNPPFEKFQDIRHVLHAYNLLNPSGILVSIMGESTFFNTRKIAEDFRNWLNEKNAYIEKLLEKTFMNTIRPTNINCRLILIKKELM
jgi:hypothetical protein